jgi:hypothetical protein
LFIEHPFTPGCLSGAYNTDSVIILGIRIGMDHKHYRDGPNKSDRMPSLLVTLEPIRQDDMRRIIPDPPRHIKGRGRA